MENTEFEHQKRAYHNYVKFFTPELLCTNTIYKDLYNTLDKNLELTKASLGDYFFEQLLIVLNNNLSRIENEIDHYVQKNNYNNIQKEHIFYHKPLLENRINELFEEYKLKKKSKTKEEGTITYYDKILKELKIIEIIFHSQMNPDLHLGSGMGLSRYCNKIFIISDVELLKISDYKREYTSRLEQSNNTSLVINELKNIYHQSVELYNFFVNNLLNHPNKKDFFVGEDAEHQITNSTGYYHFINYKVSFCFFEVEQSSEIMSNINSKFFKNGFRYKCKNENLINFCTQLLDFIKLSDVFNYSQTTTRNLDIRQNPFPLIFTGTNNKTFSLFETFTKQHILDKYIDFSFIFQQMKFNGYISDIKHLKFMEWLNENNYITEKEYSDFKIEKSFRSLKKCAFGTRVDLYLKLQKEIIQSNSD